MKPSKPLKVAAVTLGVGVALTSCSLLGVKTEVSAQQVAVDLTFGAPSPSGAATPSGFTLPTLTAPVISLPPTPEPTEEPTPKPTNFVCPIQPTAAGARDTSPASMNVDDNIKKRNNTPPPGLNVYQFSYEHNYDGKPAFRGEGGFKIIEMADSDRNPETNEFRYSLEDTITNMKFVFHSVGVENGAGQANTNPGLFLTEIDIPKKDSQNVEERYKFIPKPELKLVAFPIENNMETRSSGTDNEGKQEVSPGQFKPSLNQMVSTVTVGGKEQVSVCYDYADTWKVIWELRIDGEFDLALNGTFWLDTAYGGWPAREDFIMSSKTLTAGNFASSLMMLDPTEYL